MRNTRHLAVGYGLVAATVGTSLLVPAELAETLGLLGCGFALVMARSPSPTLVAQRSGSLLLAIVLVTSTCRNVSQSTPQFRHLQMRTMSQILSWATALECYRIDHDIFPFVPALQVSNASSFPGAPHQFFLSTTSFSEIATAWPIRTSQRLDLLRPYLSPIYLPDDRNALDGWGNPLLVALTEDRQGLTILSRGSDGDIDSYHEHGSFPGDQHWRDIVWVEACEDAGYVAAPSGIAQR